MKKSELYSMLWEACNKLRGGVEPSRYKDYVLVLLFFKYVSDRYKGQPFAEFTISKGASFEDLIEAKGKSDVGERVDKIIQKFLEDNRLQGSLPDVSFNNPEELGSGKELVDKVSGLIAVFQNPAIDFKNNRASGDDIIGDAYEYFMMKFAQESGKSKGQFYTPSEVSRIIARLIGIGDIKQMPTKKWTLYDPAAGSGSLLIRAADEAPVEFLYSSNMSSSHVIIPLPSGSSPPLNPPGIIFTVYPQYADIAYWRKASCCKKLQQNLQRAEAPIAEEKKACKHCG